MSGIVGVLSLDGHPADLDIVSRMTHIARRRGPDGSGKWVDGPVGLGHVMFRTTPESLFDTQPLTNETNQVCLTLDGRVDNRKELRKFLVAKGMKLRSDTDSELVLRAYECWGDSCVEHILGDWAFIIWDKRNRRLFMARDPIGIRPLFYWFNGNLLVAASEIQPIFEHLTPQKEVNWAVLGDYLCGNWSEHEETLYVGVRRLPAGHIAVVEAGEFRMRRYWPSGPRREIRYRRYEKYAEHFLSLFEEAVRCRLRATTPVGILLSGGLDSSSIACTAQRLLRRGTAGSARFETLSIVYPGMDCDESFYIDAVARELDVPSHSIPYEDRPDVSPRLERARDFPDLLFGPSVMASVLLYSQRAHDRGIRVLIDGFGGDELFAARSWWGLDDALRAGDWVSLYQKLQNTWNELGGPASQILLRYGVWPLLPTSVQNMVLRLRRWTARGERDLVGSCIDPEFATQYRLQERLNRNLPSAAPVTRSLAKEKKRLFDLFTRSYNVIFALESNDRFISPLSLEKRHPFWDRRLLDFCLAIPERERLGEGTSKFLLRKALDGILPKVIAQRETKVMFDSLQNEQINVRQADAVTRLFEKLQLEADGVLKNGEAGRLLANFRQGDTRVANSIDNILALELWYRNAFNKA